MTKKYRLRDNDKNWLLAPRVYKAQLILDKHDTAYESLGAIRVSVPGSQDKEILGGGTERMAEGRGLTVAWAQSSIKRP
jgi:hypothetical protein